MPTVLLYQPEETFDLFAVRWGRSFDNCFDLAGVGSKTIAAENVFKVLDRRLNENTFLACELDSRLNVRFGKRV